MLELSKDKRNVSGLSNYQILAICFACFALGKNDEIEKSKDVAKIKWSMTNSFNDKLSGDKILEERFNAWQKHATGD